MLPSFLPDSNKDNVIIEMLHFSPKLTEWVIFYMLTSLVWPDDVDQMMIRLRLCELYNKGWNVVDRRARFHSLSVTQMTSDPENSAVFLRKINKYLPLCIIQFYDEFLDAAADCVEWHWFSKILPRPCGFMSIMVALQFHKQYRLRAWWSRAFSSGFNPWPLHTQDLPLALWIFSRY